MVRNVTVLLAEDDPNDQVLVQRALRKKEIQIDLRLVNDGLEAIEYLSGHGKFCDRKQYPLPGLIVLDINMPRRSGLEVLQWIRNDVSMKLTPVVIVSSSQLQVDVNEAYKLGVNAYLVKPSAFEELAELLKTTTDLSVHRAAKPQMH